MNATEVLADILDTFERKGVDYVVIHHADSIASQIDSDIDIAIDQHPGEILDPVILDLQRQGHVQLVSRLHYEVPWGFYYILAITDNPGQFLHLDITFDRHGSNHYLYTSAALLKDRRKIGAIWTTAPAVEATYLLIKKSTKGRLDRETHERISQLASLDPVSSDKEWTSWWTNTRQADIEDLLNDNDPARWPDALRKLHEGLGAKLRSRGGLFGIRRLYQELRRWQYRLGTPTGLFVVLLGPDGAGKSTLARMGLESCGRGFRRTDHFHWRPGLLPKPTRNSPHPEAEGCSDRSPPSNYKYGYFVSLLRYSYYLADFILGYWLKIYPAKVRTSLILGERWYYDVILNPVRYGFRLPGWILRAGNMLIPAPDLVILLDADPDNIHNRKPELAIEDIRKQLEAMHRLVDSLGTGTVITTDVSLKQSRDAFFKAVIGQRSHMTTATLWPGIFRERWYRFPRFGRPRFWLQNRDDFNKALQLYKPGRRISKLLYRIAPLAPQWLILRPESATEICNKLTSTAETLQRITSVSDFKCIIGVGTPGPHRKLTAQIIAGDEILGYAKIGESDAARNRIENEALALESQENRILGESRIPGILCLHKDESRTILVQTAPIGKLELKKRIFEQNEADALLSLASEPPGHIFPDEADLNAIWQGDIPSLRAEDADLIGDTLHFICSRLGNEGIGTGPSHGDFAPWNMGLTNDGRLYIFDWEYFDLNAPLLTDLLHRIYMPSRLIDRHAPRKSLQLMRNLWCEPRYEPLMRKSGVTESKSDIYISLYLLRQTSREMAGDAVIPAHISSVLKQILKENNAPGHRIRVLLSAYACEPHKGSEPGVGWNWAREISRNHEVTVITRSNNQSAIQDALAKDPSLRMKFEYVDLPRWLSFWKRGRRGIHLYYYLWQYAAFLRVRKLHQLHRYDIGHHLTFVNDWIWTFLALMPIPYVWGPIGSNSHVPAHLLPDSDTRIRQESRFHLQRFIRCLDPLFWLSLIRAEYILAINEDIIKRFPTRWFNKKCTVEPAIATESTEDAVSARHDKDNYPTILFAGQLLGIKCPHLAVMAFSEYIKRGGTGKLLLAGDGPLENLVAKLVTLLQIADRCELMGWQDRQALMKLMRDSDIFLYPTLESAGMVVLEAMNAGLPVVALRFGGPALMLDDNTGRLIEPGPTQQVVENLAEALLDLSSSPEIRKKLGECAKRRVAEHFTWSRKEAVSRHIYQQVLRKSVARTDTN